MLNSQNLKQLDNNSCCNVVDYLHDWWNINKYRISAPLAVGLSVLGGIGSILASQYIISTSIVIGLTNVGIFFSGIALSAFSSENRKLVKDNVSLANEKNDINEVIRRLTMIPINNLSQTVTPNNDTQRSEESIEPINFESVHRNNIINSYAFPTN